MKAVVRILLAVVLFITISSCTTEGGNSNKVTVAVAANLKYAMEDISKAFEEKHGVEVHVSSGSSGTLTAQIKNDAPFDVFISANLRYPNKLNEEGLTIAEPEVYAYGKLIMWSFDDHDLSRGLGALMDSRIKKIGVANPEIAPYGIAAMDALKNSGLYESIEDKIVFGESVGQVNQYIKSGAVDVGLTSKSGLFSLKESKRGNWQEVESDYYQPIEQGIVILKQGEKNNSENAQLFYNFMFSEEVKEILKSYGYGLK